MFLIGFLSSPIPLVLLAFFYLLMFSYGQFAKKDFSKAEEDVRTITLPSELNQKQIVDQHKTCNYFAFVQKSNKQQEKDQFESTFDKFQCPQSLQALEIPINTISKSYHLLSDLSNRPPPFV